MIQYYMSGYGVFMPGYEYIVQTTVFLAIKSALIRRYD